MINDTNMGAVPQSMNPDPGEAGLPPSQGLTQAITVTRTMKVRMSQIIFLRSKSFILINPYVLFMELTRVVNELQHEEITD